MQTVLYQSRQITPPKVVCVGRNYKKHIEELDNEVPQEPVVFVKPNSAISQEVHFMPGEDVQYEAELSFLFRNGEIAALALGLDFTKRKLQKSLSSKGLPWERSKAFDGSAVFSEFVALEDKLSDLSFEFSVNGQVVQQGSVEQMIYKPDFLISHISEFMKFHDGDILMTGTPKGVGGFSSGDVFEGKVFVNDRQIVECHWDVC